MELGGWVLGNALAVFFEPLCPQVGGPGITWSPRLVFLQAYDWGAEKAASRFQPWSFDSCQRVLFCWSQVPQAFLKCRILVEDEGCRLTLHFLYAENIQLYQLYYFIFPL